MPARDLGIILTDGIPWNLHHSNTLGFAQGSDLLFDLWKPHNFILYLAFATSNTLLI